MTGYGRAENTSSDWTIVWELKSVNGRYLDAKWRMPGSTRSLEQEFERILREHANRGRVDVNLNLEVRSRELLGVRLNVPQVMAMVEEMQKLGKELHQPYTPDLDRIMAISWLWREGDAEPDPALAQALKATLAAACEDWNRGRAVEGRAMAEDLLARIGVLEDLAARIGEAVPGVVEAKKAALAERVRELLDAAGAEYAEERALQETAMLADRLDVSEELTRLAEHLKRLREVLGREGEIGKRLDFLCQETFREINTCGNKAQDAGVSALVVEFKAELEKCREQVQNIE
jgi:uncharacterized protein (TIGR00255 family)